MGYVANAALGQLPPVGADIYDVHGPWRFNRCAVFAVRPLELMLFDACGLLSFGARWGPVADVVGRIPSTCRLDLQIPLDQHGRSGETCAT